jgi:hypothetical protein
MSTSRLQRGLDGGGVEQLFFLDLAAQVVEQVLGRVHAGVRHQQGRFEFLVQVFVDARADEQQRQVVRRLGQAGLQARHPGAPGFRFADGAFGRFGEQLAFVGCRSAGRDFLGRGGRFIATAEQAAQETRLLGRRSDARRLGLRVGNRRLYCGFNRSRRLGFRFFLFEETKHCVFGIIVLEFSA